MHVRQIVLDTETTGLDTAEGHRIIEIGCVELLNRRLTGNNFQQYLNPDREIDEGAMAVHGISNEDVMHRPRFADVVRDFMAYIKDAELIIHNADFDVGFLDFELGRIGPELGQISDYCTVLDTLSLARQLHPGQRNDLDSLCKRYEIDNRHRDLHGALLDAEILADVYLIMTGGQTAMLLDEEVQDSTSPRKVTLPENRGELLVLRPDDDELKQHERWLDLLDESVGQECIWRAQERSQ